MEDFRSGGRFCLFVSPSEVAGVISEAMSFFGQAQEVIYNCFRPDICKQANVTQVPSVRAKEKGDSFYDDRQLILAERLACKSRMKYEMQQK